MPRAGCLGPFVRKHPVKSYVGFRHFLVLAVLASAPHAIARGWDNRASELVYVQAPAFSAAHHARTQPVITSTLPDNVDPNNLEHLWSESVSFAKTTKFAELFVQRNLKPGVKYNYQATIDLGARRIDGYETKVPNGWYQFQVAVIRPADSRIKNPYDRYVTSDSMFLKVKNGKFSRRVSLSFPDIGATAAMSHLVIELIPLQENCDNTPCINLRPDGYPDERRSQLKPRIGYRSFVVEIPFIPYQGGGGSADADDLSKENMPFPGPSLAEFIAKAQLRIGKSILAPKPAITPLAHAQKENLNLVTAQDPRLTNALPYLQKIIRSIDGPLITLGQKNVEMFGPLCAALINQSQPFRNFIQNLRKYPSHPLSRDIPGYIQRVQQHCAQNPADYLRMTRVIHVGEVSGDANVPVERALKYTMIANYVRNRSHSVETYTGVNVNATVKLPSFISKFTDAIGIGGGGGTSQTVGWSNSRSTSETGIASTSNGMDFNFVGAEIPTVDSQQCLEVRVSPDAKGGIYDATPGANNGFYICLPRESGELTVRETYAHMFEPCRDSTMSSCNSKSQLVNHMARGEREISALFYGIRDGITADHDNRVIPFGTIKKAEAYFNAIPVEDEMEVITPVVFEREVIPSFWQKLTAEYQERFTN